VTASVQQATELYEAAATLQLGRTCVGEEAFQRYSLAVSELQNRLGEDADDSYWQPVLRRLRRARWDLATVPLPFSHPAFEIDQAAAFLAERLIDCDRVFPAHATAPQEIARVLAELGASDADPLGTAIRDLPLPRPAALLLQNARHGTAVEETLARPLGLAVLTPPQLAGGRVYGGMAVLGPGCWFPHYVFAAPKARDIHVVQFTWLSDDQIDARILAGSAMGASGHSALPAHGGGGADGGGIASADLLPVTDWAAIAAGTGGAADGGADRPDTVDAYLLLLASEQAVYVEAEDGSHAYIAELGSSRELHMVPTRSIQPGTYLVNRVGGEGDYIPAIADTLLGQHAPRLRAAQRRWKEPLRQLVESRGVQAMLSRLEAAGAQRANRANLRRWLSAGSIRTEHRADFGALTEVAGIADDTDELWRDMEMIDQAHRRAGQRVRRLLVKEILDGDTRELEVRGWQDYDVEEIEGEGALRVARVEARHPDTLRVSARQTRQLLPVERDLWQG
jgi:hypothetical protein